jgi:hypothetical protein
VSLAVAGADEEGWWAMVIREGEDGETGAVLLADAPVLARLLFLLRSSESDGERERFLVCSVSGMVRQFQCYFLVFLWVCGMARGMGVILGDMDLEGNVRGMRGRRKGRTRFCTDIP